MSSETPSLAYWTPFLDYVSDELEVLNTKLKNICDDTRRVRRHAMSAKSVRELRPKQPAYDSESPRRRRNAKTRRSNVTPTIRRHVEADVECPVQTNYKSFPARKNASARIYRPHRLDCPVYRNEKKIVAVLNGEVIIPEMQK